MMVWLAVLALILAAVAITIGITATRQIAALGSALSWSGSELQRRDNEVKSVQNDVSLASKQLAVAQEQLQVSRENYDEAIEQIREQARQLAHLWRRADAHFLTADADSVEATRLVTELEHYAVVSLEQAVAGSRPRILRGGLYARRPVLDLVPDLVDGFLTAVQAGLMYRQADPPGSRFYLRWPKDLASPDTLLDALLHAAEKPVQPDEPPGTSELRTLLHAVQAGSPAILQLGPLVVERTATRLSAGIAPVGWHGPSDEQKQAALDGNEPDELITQIGASRVIDWPTEPTA